MMWRNNFLVNDDPTTIEGFLEKFFPLCFFKHPEDIFFLEFHIDKKHIPKQFLFANFQCLRCGLCCKNYECAEIGVEEVEKWETEGQENILKHIWILRNPKNGRIIHAEVLPTEVWGSCTLCRKVRSKPFYSCKIHYANLSTCKAYLCSKSLPAAHLKYETIDELIEIIGLEGYYALIERDWGEEFDYSKCGVKTHKKRCYQAG